MSRHRNIRIIAVRRQQPNIRLLVLSLIEFARQLQEEEQTAMEVAGARQSNRKDAADG